MNYIWITDFILAMILLSQIYLLFQIRLRRKKTNIESMRGSPRLQNNPYKYEKIH